MYSYTVHTLRWANWLLSIFSTSTSVGWYQEDNVRWNRSSINKGYLRQNNVEVKDLATIPPDMPPAEQVLHIVGQHDMVWCRILTPKPLQALAMMLQEERGLISQHQIRHIAGQIKELSVGSGALQPDIAI